MRAAALDIRATLSSDQLIGFVKSGRNIRISKCANDNRLISIYISIYGWMQLTLREMEIPRNRYEDLIKETVTSLAERHGSDLRVEVRSDHYGRRWVEVHSGFLGRRTSRLGLSPRHINMLQNALQACAQLEQAS